MKQIEIEFQAILEDQLRLFPYLITFLHLNDE